MGRDQINDKLRFCNCQDHIQPECKPDWIAAYKIPTDQQPQFTRRLFLGLFDIYDLRGRNSAYWC